ncbi:MAG: RDD family protein [Actinomycetota bacterium]|nr:RDD family protein [Actinomycetota bacterium]
MSDGFPPPGASPGGDVVDLPTASIGRRFVARLADGVIVLAVTFPLWGLTGILEVDAEDPDAAANVPLWVLAVMLVVSGVYEILPLVLWGRTPGKRLLGLVVEDTGGGYLGWHQATIRYLLPNAVALIPAPIGLLAVSAVYGSALAHPERRGWHDRAAGSIVLQAR